MRFSVFLLAVVAMAVAGAGSAQAQLVPYDFEGSVSYHFGGTDSFGITASPDTGFLTITNNGPSPFTGSISLTGQSNFGGALNSVFNGTFAPGASLTFASGSEGSNVGGWNGPFGGPTPQLGLKFEMNGIVALGPNSQAIDRTIYDKDIHSGVPRTNPFGVTLDNYILQGGDPFGRDTQDAYETTQAPATFAFKQSLTVVPEPTSLTLCGIGITGLIGYGWRRRKVVVA